MSTILSTVSIMRVLKHMIHLCYISAHVSIKNIQILNILKVSEDEENIRHIFGAHFDDRQQLYTGTVFINGSLTFENIKVSPHELFLKGEITSTNIDFYKKYWLKTSDQVSLLSHFISYNLFLD